MTRSEFNKAVTKRKKEILKMSAQRVFDKLETQHLYRSGGLNDKSFNDILTEMAQADILDVDLIEYHDINQDIKNL